MKSPVLFYLKSPKAKHTTVFAQINAYSQKYRVYTKIKIKTSLWSEKDRRLKETNAYEEAIRINAKLDAWEELISKAWTNVDVSTSVPTQIDLDNEIARLQSNKDRDKDSLLDYAEQWVITCGLSERSIKNHRVTINRFREYEQSKNTTIRFVDVDKKFYKASKHYFDTKKLLIAGTKPVQYQTGYSLNTVSGFFKHLKTWMKESADDKMHNIVDLKFIKRSSETADSIFLSVDELVAIHRLNIDYDLILDNFPELTQAHRVMQRLDSLSNTRDRALLGAFTALRFQDYRELELSVGDNTISVRHQKTNIRTSIPIHWVIKEMWERRGRTMPPPVTNQALNDSLKLLGKIAGINQIVSVTRTMGGKKVTKQVPKWKLISTHTMRRSACTNMYLEGIPLKVIMSFSGHTKISTLLSYIRASQLEDAIRMIDHPYFTGNK